MLAALAVVAAVAGGVGATVAVTNDHNGVSTQTPTAVVEQVRPNESPATSQAPQRETHNPFLEANGL
jgi:hypothetical protein